MVRRQILSYGGGVQSVTMIVLSLKGKLPMPDMIVFADTGREKTSTLDYMAEIVNPALQAIGKQVEMASHSLATVDMYSGNGDLLIPAYTATGKLPTFCSTEWKERVVKRLLRQRGVDFCDCWIGYSMDESNRANRNEDAVWYKRRYPLLELGLTRADCEFIIEDYGWPLPFKSACWMCPNQDDDGWLQTKNFYPADFARAVALDLEIREDDELYLHESRKPLSEAVFASGNRRRKEGHYQCSFGCFI